MNRSQINNTCRCGTCTPNPAQKNAAQFEFSCNESRAVSPHLGVAKIALEIAHGKSVFDPSNDRCEKLAVDYPDLCTAVLLAADGDNSGLKALNKSKPDLFEYVFHKVRSLTANYDKRIADLEKEYKERTTKHQVKEKEEYIESPDHTCGGYSLEKGKPNSDLVTTFYKSGRVKVKRKFHSKRLWRTCPGCAHDRILREVPKIQDEQKLYNLFYTVMHSNDYKKLVSRFTTWRSRSIEKWHTSIKKTPEGEPLPKPPHDIIYIGYKISGGVVVVHNQTSLVRRGKEKYELVPMPTEKRAIYELVGKWVADAPLSDNRQFIVGSRGFGGKFSGTREIKKAENKKGSDGEELGVKSIKFKFPNCSTLTEKKIKQLLKIQDKNCYGLSNTKIGVIEFRSDLKAQGIEHEIMGGEGLYRQFVTEVGVISKNCNDAELRHKQKQKPNCINANNDLKLHDWSQNKLFREDAG